VSRAEPALPPPPRLGRVLKTAGVDLYYHGVRLVVVNVLWGIGFIIAIYLLTRSLLGVFALIPLVPMTMGLMGMAAIVHREQTLVLSDFTRSIRSRLSSGLVIGCAQIVLLVMAVVNLLIGVELGGVLGLGLAVVAFYTVAAVCLLAVVAWPLLMDPLRAAEPAKDVVRLGVILILAHPLRIIGLAALVGAMLAVSTVLAAALVTFAGAYVFLVCAHYVLPAGDRLEGRHTVPAEE
jgi:hypothetical protein